MNKTPTRKKHRLVKILLLVLGALAVLSGILFTLITVRPQIAVGLIQKLTYGNAPINSYEPFYEPVSGA